MRIFDDFSATVSAESQPNHTEMITPENIVSTRVLVEDSIFENGSEPLSCEDCLCCERNADGGDDDVIWDATAAGNAYPGDGDDDDEMQDQDTLPPLPRLSWSEIVDSNDGSPILRERVGMFHPRVLFPPRKRGVVAAKNDEAMKKKKLGT